MIDSLADVLAVLTRARDCAASVPFLQHDLDDAAHWLTDNGEAVGPVESRTLRTVIRDLEDAASDARQAACDLDDAVSTARDLLRDLERSR